MKTLAALVFAGVLSAASAAGPVRELDPQVAARLIAEIDEVLQQPITVVSVIEGSLKKDDFEVRHVRRVTVILPVTEDGGRVRRIRCYDFCWSDAYGWFYAEEGRVRGGDEVRIWSETQGEVILR